MQNAPMDFHILTGMRIARDELQLMSLLVRVWKQIDGKPLKEQIINIHSPYF